MPNTVHTPYRICPLSARADHQRGIVAPVSFVAWLSNKGMVYAWMMTGKRYSIGSLDAYQEIEEIDGKSAL